MRKNRIIATLMALLMTLSAFSGLITPVYAESAQIKDAVWTGFGYYVTGDNSNYKLEISDPDTFVADPSSTTGGIKTFNNSHKLELASIKNADGKNVTALKIKNIYQGKEYHIVDFATGAMQCIVQKDNADGGTVQTTVTEYPKMEFATQYDKLLTMQKMLENETHILFVQPYTGEVACYDKRSGQTLSTNPYDVSTVNNKSDSIGYQLMSQIMLDYTDLTGNSKTMTSYEHAALEGQIKVKVIKNGIRVEYTMGREEANYLVPRRISKERYESKIKGIIDAHPDAGLLVKKRFEAFYIEKNPETETLEKLKQEMLAEYPITKKMPIYVLSTDIVPREIAQLEEYIKTYCPDYTYDDLEFDHNQTEYEGLEKAPANFKLSIEYSLNSDGMTARLPANGIRYDATNYTLKTIKVLPYMGAGSNENTGYIFLPDGSGSITRFEDYVNKSINVAGTLYGTDYAYHTVSGKLQETMRLPVYGIVDNDSYEVIKFAKDETVDENGNVTEVKYKYDGKEIVNESKGFLTIIEEGDAMVSIMSTSGAQTHKYFNVVTSFSPRQSDEYRLSDSISAASTAAIIVESKRKYVGSLTMKYVMLTDEKIAETNQITDYYETSWMGMANAYRSYLTSNGVLNKLEGVSEDIPLYIETFGTLQTTEKIASIPVTVDKALTSFDDVITMYNELSEQGVSNVNFKLQGYYNGGMYSTAPYKLDWQKAAGGADGFQKLVDYAKEKNFGVYPDFDFAYLYEDEWFDGFNAKDHAVKTIDNRYSSRVMYNPAKQDYSTKGGICISPSAYTYLFEGLDKNYSKYGNNSISVSTLGYALNSDFDEDDPYNREDSKRLTAEVLDQISQKYENVMAEGGNAYTLKYIDHLLGVSLDSSRYALTSAAVPFMGVVLHGSVNFTGTPINMEGDMDYALLKAIENGASLYFILSYDNTELLKEDAYLSQYYSVRYDIWKEDVIKTYNKLNNAIGDLQDQLIVDHDFLEATRVPDEDELASDKIAAEKAELDRQAANINKVTLNVSRRLELLYLEEKIPYGYKFDSVEMLEEVAAIMKDVFTDGSFNSVTVTSMQTDEEGVTVVVYSDYIVLTISAEGKVKVGISEDAYEVAKLKIEENKLKAEEEKKKQFNKYATTYGTVAKVVYENGATFILNYNDYSVITEVDGVQYTVPAYTFVTIKNGTVYNFNASEDVIGVSVVGSADGAKTVASGESISIK